VRRIFMGKDKPSPRERVVFRPPLGMKKAKRISGKIVGWTPWRLAPGDWGQYVFQAQRIKWDHGWESVRIVYYRRNRPRGRWQFASQTTVNSTVRTIKAICRDILKTPW
jgi:hypothetical protein